MCNSAHMTVKIALNFALRNHLTVTDTIILGLRLITYTSKGIYSIHIIKITIKTPGWISNY